MRIVAGGAIAALLTGVTPVVGQEALLGIYGAWVHETNDCRKIFAKDNSRVVFAAQSQEPLPAFIINPASISNNEYLCSVKEYKVRLAEVTFTGSCDLGSRKRRQKFTIQELNGRFRVEVGREFVPIKRCNPDELTNK